MKIGDHLLAHTEVVIDDDTSVDVTWEFSPGEAPIIVGPVECCDPGSAPELLSCEVRLSGGQTFPDGTLYLLTAIGEDAYQDALNEALDAAEALEPPERDYEWEPPSTAYEHSEDWS